MNVSAMPCFGTSVAMPVDTIPVASPPAARASTVALGGSELWRGRFMRIVTTHFLLDVFRQTLRNLWHDGELFKARSWRSGWQLLFAREGLLREIYRPWKAYFEPDFHPRQQDDSLSARWLDQHTQDYSVVGR